MKTVTRDIAMYHTGTFHHVRAKNADGTPARCRVNGICRTWKRRSEDFRLPVKHGLRNCFYITPENCSDWYVTDEDWRDVCRKMLCEQLKLEYNTPDCILHDCAIENGLDHIDIVKALGV